MGAWVRGCVGACDVLLWVEGSLPVASWCGRVGRGGATPHTNVPLQPRSFLAPSPRTDGVPASGLDVLCKCLLARLFACLENKLWTEDRYLLVVRSSLGSLSFWSEWLDMYLRMRKFIRIYKHN